MVGKQAKILTYDQIRRLLVFVSTTRNPVRNCVLVLLSLKAGLRAGEIASLTWADGFGPRRRNYPLIELRDHAAKKGSGPHFSHPDLRGALVRLVLTSSQVRQLANKCVFVIECSALVTAMFRRRLRWVGRIDAGLREKTAKLVGTRPSLSKRLGS
jgi:integrase